MPVPPILVIVTEALMDLTGGFYLNDSGTPYTVDINEQSATATKGFKLKVLRSIRYLTNHIPAAALAEMQTLALTFANITVGTGQSYKVSSRVETRIQSVIWAPVSGFAVDVNGNAVDAGTAGTAVCTIAPPHGCVLNEAHVLIDPAAGHGGVLPTTPQFFLHSNNITTGVTSTEATGTDASATAGAYEAAHLLSATSIGLAINRTTKAYKIHLVGESGGSAQNALLVHGMVKLVYTRTTIGED